MVVKSYFKQKIQNQTKSFILEKCHSDGELWQHCPILPARDLNLGPPAPETSASPLDQLAGLTEKLFL